MAYLKRGILASIVSWIPLAALTVLISGMVYAAVQQDYRNSANDPQLQMATDARNALVNGATPQSLVPSEKLDIAQSLSPYLAIYDTNGQLVASSATLHGQSIAPPPGVFDSAKTATDIVTWMPEQDVRSAIVVLHYANGYVLSGRSLTIVEQRESDLEQIVGAACVATLAITYLAVLVTRLVTPRLVPVGP